MTAYWVDGVAASTVPADDRGLAYGDGVFETIPVVGQRPALLEAHLRRLQAGCRALGFEPPGAEILRADIARAVTAGDADAVVRLTVTRGSGGRGYSPPAAPEPRRLVARGSRPQRPHDWWLNGIAVRVCRTPVVVNPALAGIKHLGRVEQIVARGEWASPALAEGLMRDRDGCFVEFTAANLLIVKGQQMISPPLESMAVHGIMRATLMAAAERFGLQAICRPITDDALLAADEVLSCNSVNGVLSVRHLDGRALPRGRYAMAFQEWLMAHGVVWDWLGEASQCAESSSS